MTQTNLAARSADEAKTVAQSAKDQSGAVVSTAKEEATAVATQARDELRRHASDQTRRVGEQLQALGSQLSDLGNGRGATDGPVADFLRNTGSRVSDMASSIDQRGLDGLLEQTRSLARRRPGAYLAGAFAVGIVAGRVFRNLDMHAVMDAAKSNGDTGAAQPTPGPTASTASTTQPVPAESMASVPVLDPEPFATGGTSPTPLAGDPRSATPDR